MAPRPFTSLARKHTLVVATVVVGVLGSLGAESESGHLNAQDEFNYDEGKVPQFDLPDPLTMLDGAKVTQRSHWPARRQELVKLFETHWFGTAPGRPERMSFRVVSNTAGVVGGAADLRQVDVLLQGDPNGPKMSLAIFLPAKRKGPVPMFVGLNFGGNHTVTDEPSIPVTKVWVRNRDGITDHRATEASRGSASSRWPIANIARQGYGVCTIYCGDIDPDFDDGFKNGVHPLWLKGAEPKADSGGAIAAWAWGLSRALDYLETDADVDAKKFAVIGHSRLGKTALWAGATDQRFGVVISNNSGCGGAALNRRRFGETVKRINTSFPHWFCDNFTKYNDNENALPVDSHELLALIAPRGVYVASATEDRWADPRGEFLALVAASPVYRLLGRQGLEGGLHQATPAPMAPIHRDVGFHLRNGKHDVTDYDWQQYMAFAVTIFD